MAGRTKAVIAIKTIRLVMAVAMLFAVVAGALGYDMGVQSVVASAGGVVGVALAAVIKATYFA